MRNRLLLYYLIVLLFTLLMDTNGQEKRAVVHDEDTEWGRALLEHPIDKGAAASCRDTTSADTTISAPDEQVEVAIVGGGLAGLAVAIGLSRKGIPCKVYERAPELRSVSQGMMSLEPNGMAALEQIHPDLPALVTKIGVERLVNVFTQIQANGTVTEDIRETGEEALEKYGRYKVSISWSNMQRALASLLPPGVVVTGHSLSHFSEQDDSVTLHFESGKTVRAAAILACDGTFSAARRQMHPTDSPIFFGQLNWATVIETSKLPSNIHPPRAVRVVLYHGVPRWGSFLNDAGSGLTFWQLRVANPSNALALSGNNGRGGLGLTGVKQRLLSVAAPSSDVVAAIESTPESQIFERSIVGHAPISTWRSVGGRLALVGDSAHGMHPNIGQGANTAFESAAAVIEAMAQHKEDGDWKAALMEYETVRKARAEIVQRFANVMGVSQATGKQMLERAVINELTEWILRNDPEKQPPAEVVEALERFDPCEQPGVSLLW